jgi:predicted PurR-regulated permease PerM
VREALIAVLQNFENTLLQLPMQAIGVLFDALVVTFLSLYLLIAGPGLKRFALSLTPVRGRPRTSRVLARMGHAMGGYVRGAAISGALVALLTWVALAIVGLEYRRVLAALAFFGEFVPYLGPMLAAAPALVVAMSESTGTAIAVALVYLGLQQVESYIIAPNVMKTQTQVPPSLVIFALVAGFSIGGLVGALAALPLFAAGRVLLLAVAPAIRQRSSTIGLSRSRRSLPVSSAGRPHN